MTSTADELKRILFPPESAKPPKGWRPYLMRLFGLTQDAYAALLAKQDGTCGICSQPPTLVDLDDERRVRGLLCRNCNTAVSKLKSDYRLAGKATVYLTSHLLGLAKQKEGGGEPETNASQPVEAKLSDEGDPLP